MYENNLWISFLIVMAICYVVMRFKDKWHMAGRMAESLRRRYGRLPSGDEHVDERMDEIAIYYRLLQRKLAEDEQVDDITWNDLEMDTIFKQLNGTLSFAGEQLLYSELHRLPKGKKHLERREDMIRFFDSHERERGEVQARLLKLRKEPVHYYIPEYMELLQMQRLAFPGVCKGLLLSLILLAAAAIATGQPYVTGAFVLNFLINLMVYVFGKMHYEVFLDSLAGIIQIVNIAGFLSKMPGIDNGVIRENIKGMEKMTRSALALARKKQAAMTGEVFALVQDYVMGALMWDFMTYDRVVRLLENRQDDFMALYRFVGEVDMCIAIASYRAASDGWCVPEFSGERLEAKGLYHPLVSGAVGNDLKMEKNIMLTGSNASGKSTFIKAVAVNLILAQNIHTCMARAMKVPDVCVRTSMAVRDSIVSGESYYMREIKYLGRMVAGCLGTRRKFYMIDEILKGTNTKERLAASIAILRYLNQMNCSVMVASHDLELALTMADTYDNYYFCEKVGEKDVVFDYILRRGVSQTRNAIHLLKIMGYPEEIIENAWEIIDSEPDSGCIIS